MLEQAHRRRERPAGFTLIELVLAMGLFAFGILGLSGFLFLLERTEAEQVVAAKTLFCAQEKMEAIRYQSLVEGLHTLAGKETLNEPPYHRIRRHWNIRPSSLHPRLLWVRVECSCAYKGTSISRSLQTLLFKDD